MWKRKYLKFNTLWRNYDKEREKEDSCREQFFRRIFNNQETFFKKLFVQLKNVKDIRQIGKVIYTPDILLFTIIIKTVVQ